MGPIFRRTSTIFAGTVILAVFTDSSAEIVTIGERDYEKVSAVAAAHGMEKSDPRSDPREVSFAGPEHSLVVKEDSRQALIEGVRHWLSFPAKRESGELFVSSFDVEKTIEPTLDPAAAEELPEVRTVVFDPGHGGHDRGGKSLYGHEKTYALDVVNRTRKILEGRGIRVVQSRLGDSFVNLSARPAMTKNYEGPIFISVHFNSASWRPAASGLEVFALAPSGAPSTGVEADAREDAKERPGDPNEPASFLLANTIHQSLLADLEGFDRGVKRARFSVLRNAEVPAVLIEGGFLSNPEEARKIDSPPWRQKFSEALADAITAYIEFANEGVLPERAIDSGREPVDEFVPEG